MRQDRGCRARRGARRQACPTRASPVPGRPDEKWLRAEIKWAMAMEADASEASDGSGLRQYDETASTISFERCGGVTRNEAASGWMR